MPTSTCAAAGAHDLLVDACIPLSLRPALVAMRDLFDQARKGSEPAHRAIDREIRRISKAVCWRGGPGGVDVDSDDVAQEAARYFFTVGIHRFRKRGSEESFLYAIVRTTLLQIVRSSVRRRRREDTAAEHVAVRDDDPDHVIDVRKILARLSEDCARLLTRVFLRGESYAALARELSMLESSVRTKVSRCLRRARRLAGGTEIP